MAMQYKVVVVEDEPIILKNAIQKIENSDPAFKVEGTASNGIDAIALIDSVNPDVLFTDIRMPIMDGLELIRQVKKRFPRMEVVILSGYNEFEYAQQAIKLGVTEYLLKPLKIDALAETLGNIKSKLEAEISVMENHILSSEVNGHPVQGAVPGSLACSFFTLLLVCTGHLCNHIASGSQLKLFNDLWSKVAWDELLPPLIPQNCKFWVIDEKQPNQKLIILSCQTSECSIPLNHVQALKEKLSGQVAPLPISICTDSAVILYAEIWAAAQKLRLWLDQGLVTGKSAVITPASLKNTEHLTPALDTAVQSKITALIKSGNRKLLQQELHSLLGRWKQAQYPQRSVEKALHQFLKLFQAQSLSVSDAEIYHLENMLIEKLALSTDLSGIYEDVWEIFDSVFTCDVKDTDDIKELADRIEEYLKMNFTQSITLEEISKKYNFHPSYLTRVFKKYKGDTPIKYLITLRIEEAKRLMENNPELDLKEIGRIAGYSDQHYFSRIFKNITGHTLSEYREQIPQKNRTHPVSKG